VRRSREGKGERREREEESLGVEGNGEVVWKEEERERVVGEEEFICVYVYI